MKKTKGRLQQPPPPYFRKLRNVMGAVGAIGAAVLAAPVSLPSMVVTAAGYAFVIGIVGATISQLPTEGNEK